MSNDLVLYHYWRSSCSWRVRWSLYLKNIPFKGVTVNLLKNEQRSAAYTQLNPSQTVPTLVINGQAMSESMAILEWLEEVYPQVPLLPTAAIDRARVRELCQTVVSGIQPIQNLKVLNHISQDANERQAFGRHWIRAGLTTLETKVRATAGTYCFGSQVTLADLCLIPQCYNAERFQIDLTEFPTLERIYRASLKTPACDKAAPHNQPDAQPTA